MSVDPNKIQSILDWPRPNSIKALQGFLGLTGYYIKFIKTYSIIAVPLSKLLQKNNFHWKNESEEAFNMLKEALSKPPVLVLLDFSKDFVIECDTCGVGIETVLMQ